MYPDLLIGAISKIIHLEIKADCVVGLLVQLETVRWHEVKVVIRSPFIKQHGRWERDRLIIDQISCNVSVQGRGDCIKEILCDIRTPRLDLYL